MTTLVDIDVICAVCGKASRFKDIASTNSFGYADLDLRPPEMERSTIGYGVQRCPGCGFCSSTIGKEKRRARTTISMSRYKFQLQDDRFPELANSYLCASMVDEHAGNQMWGAWMALNAAWVCDDHDLGDLARICRVKALEMFHIGLWAGLEFGSSATPYVVMLDLMRRSGLSRGLPEIVNHAMENGPNEIEQKVILFQMDLLARGDEKCHTIEKALDHKGCE